MTNVVLMTTTLMAVMGTAALQFTRIEMKIATNHRSSVKRFYKAEGVAQVAAQYFWGNHDMNEDTEVDREQVKTGAVITYDLYGLQVTLSQIAVPNHTASIVVDGLVEMRVENFPGNQQGGTMSGHANPDVRGWRHIQ